MLKKLSKIMTLVMAISMLTACGGAGGSTGDGDSEAANRLEAIKERGVLQVTTEPYFAPQEFIDPTKSGQEQYVGADMELAKLIAERMGVELEIIPLEFGPVMASVVEGKYDLAISAMAYTPERAETMELSDGYHFVDESTEYGLLIRTEDAESIKTVDDLADRIIVTQSGSLQEALVNDQIPKYKEFKRVSSMSPDAFLSVQEGKADAAAVAVENAQLYIDANPDCGMQIMDGFYFTMDEKFGGTRIGAPKGETELIEFVNEILAEINENGQYEKWFAEAAEYAASLGIE